MSYTATYKDENGETRAVSITEEDSCEALKNDYAEVLRRYNPRVVSISRAKAEAGEALHLKVTVNAPSHYVTNADDVSPKPCDSMTADVICRPGYPLTKVEVQYSKDRRLASPNVFTSGRACIDNWIPFTSSLLTVIDKITHDIIHDPNVSRYESPACSDLIQWHKEGVLAGIFPTIPPKALYAPERGALPPRRSKKLTAAPPPLPRRKL